MVLVIEVANFLVILCNDSMIKIVMDFIALAIIAEFDDFYYDSLQEDELKKMIDEGDVQSMLVIEHTTSRKAKKDTPSNKFVTSWPGDEDLQLKKYHINFWKDRDSNM